MNPARKIERGQLAALLNADAAPPALSATEWETLARMTQGEGVAPLAYWILAAGGNLAALPEAAQGLLRAAYSTTWKHNQALFNALETLTHAFARAQLPAVVLKGACHALTIYPDPGARPMGDLDLLVPAARWREAVQLAQAAGYAEHFPEAAPGLNELLNHAACLQKQGVVIEIHHTLAGSRAFKYSAPVDWFWEQTQPLNHPRFADALILTPTAQLLYAASHAMLQHGGKRAPLRWFADMHLLIRAGQVDWALLVRQAKIFAWGSAVEAALQTTREYFATPLPPGVCAELARQADPHRGLVEALRHKPSTHTLEEWQKLRALNTYGKLRLLLALLFPSPAYMRARYGLKTHWALPIYYPRRWGGIVADGLRTLRALLTRNTAGK